MINLSLPGFEPVSAMTAAEAFIGADVAAASYGAASAGAAASGAAATGGGLSGFFNTPLSEITIGQAMGGSLLSQGVTGLVGAALQGSKKMPQAGQMPGMESPPTMPIPDDQAAEAARRRRIAEIQNRSGRQSTFLSEEARGERLGAG